MEIKISVRTANLISEKSWLRDPNQQAEWFVSGYQYAATQTTAISALSKVSPEELYHAVTAILYGAEPAPPCCDTWRVPENTNKKPEPR